MASLSPRGAVVARLSFDAKLAAWLIQHRVALKEDFSTSPSEPQRLLLSPAAAVNLHNGGALALLLVSLRLASPGQLWPGTEARAVYHNWLDEKDGLVPLLERTLGIFLRPTERVLLLGGDPKTLVHLVDLVHSRVVVDVRAVAYEHRFTVTARLGKLKQALQGQDMLETIGLVVAQLSAVYAALLASFLCVFVPQSCPPSEQFSGRHECTVRENTHAPLSLFNQAALAINCWTLLVVGIGLSLVAYRENFLIKFFEVEEGLPSNALQEEIRLYPELQARLTRLNNLCYTFLCVVVVSMFVNLIISAVFILAGTNSMGKNSMIGLASSTLLLFPRVTMWLITARRAVCVTPSVYFFGKAPRVSNAIDPEWRLNPKFFRPETTQQQPSAEVPTFVPRSQAVLASARPPSTMEMAPAAHWR